MQDAQRLSDYLGIVATAWDGTFGRDAVRLVAGRDTDALVLGTNVVFRFPKHRRALEALPREVAVLTAIAAADGVRPLVPEVLVDRSQDVLGRAFVAHRYLPGEPLPRSSVDAVGPLGYRFAAELARVLDAFAGLPLDGLPLTRAPLCADFAELAAACGPEAAAAFAAVEALDRPDPVLVHGDLVGGKLRWDADETRLTGVLGWSQVHAGDPAYDVASLAETYGWDLATTVCEATRGLDEGVVRRARGYAATFPFQRSL